MTNFTPHARFGFPSIPLRSAPRVTKRFEKIELCNREERRESLTADLHIHGSKSPRDQLDDVVVVQLVSEELDDFAL